MAIEGVRGNSFEVRLELTGWEVGKECRRADARPLELLFALGCT
jgi:hypothetical protein